MSPQDPRHDRRSLAQSNPVWASIGLRSFGGPTAQIALMHRVLVEEQGWLTESEFLDALGFCMLLPGPEAMQLATYAGWKRHGVAGGLLAGMWFVLPGALVVGALAVLYAQFGQQPWLLSAFMGIRAAVLVLVFEATLRIARRTLQRRSTWIVSLSALFGIGWFGAPYPLLITGAGIIGAVFLRNPGRGAPALATGTGIRWTDTLRTLAVWSVVWAAPLLAVAWGVGADHTLSRLAVFFSRLAVVTFGGAYAVLGYMAQDVVQIHGWLTAQEMLDGLGLAETTPGPLILVTEFVGFLAAHRAHPEAALLMGSVGAAVALWATFVPCFLWIFAGAPYLERVRAEPRLQGALAAITAAVLGVIVSLALWFATHVLFRAHDSFVWAGRAIVVPRPASLDPAMVLLVGLSALLLVVRRWPVTRVLVVVATAAVLLRTLTAR